MAMAGQAGQYAPQYSAGYSYPAQFSVTPQPQFSGFNAGMGGMAGGLGGMAGGFNAPFGGFGGFPQGGLGPQASQSMDPEQITDQKRKALEYLDNQKAQALETAGKHAESQKQMFQPEAARVLQMAEQAANQKRAQDMLRLDQQYHQMLHQTEQQRSQQLMQIEQMAMQLNAQAERNKNMKEMYDKYQANAPQGNPGVQPGMGSPMPMGVMSPQMGPGAFGGMGMGGMPNAYAAAPMSYP